MAFWARKVFGTFEKRAPVQCVRSNGSIYSQKTHHCMHSFFWCFDNLFECALNKWTQSQSSCRELFARNISVEHARRTSMWYDVMTLITDVCPSIRRTICCMHSIYVFAGGSEDPDTKHRVLNSGGTGSRWSGCVWKKLCDVFLLQGWAFGMGPLRSCWTPSELLLARMCMRSPARYCSFGLMLHRWRLALTVSLCRFLGRPWFRLRCTSSTQGRRLGRRYPSIRMIRPTHGIWALMNIASILVQSIGSKPSTLETLSCHLIPRMERRALTLKYSSFLMCFR